MDVHVILLYIWGEIIQLMKQSGNMVIVCTTIWKFSIKMTFLEDALSFPLDNNNISFDIVIYPEYSIKPVVLNCLDLKRFHHM